MNPMQSKPMTSMQADSSATQLSWPAVACLIMLGCLLCPLHASPSAVPEHEMEPVVEALALFRGRAFLRIDGDLVLMREGESHRSGVVLIAADGEGATVSWQGEERPVSLTRQTGGVSAESAPQEIRLSPDRLGQYRVPGRINGQAVSFMVDTGASMVAISQRQAQQLGLDYRRGEQGTVVTAQGQAMAWFFDLEQVEVGGMEATYVQAAVIQGNFPVEILLGMSFLSQIRMEHDGNIMLLQERR
jgi:aspartyl protease family protein